MFSAWWGLLLDVLRVLLGPGLLRLAALPLALDLLLALVRSPAVGGSDAREIDAELLGGAQEVVVLVAHLDATALLGAYVHVERERLHLLEQHLERLRDRGLGDVLALDDRLVGLHAPDGVVGLDREHLLEGVRRAVGLERPHLHLAEAMAAELRLAAQRLLGDERIGTGAARVDLVVHEVQQLQDVHVADGDLLLVRLARAAVVERHLARAAPAGPLGLVDVEGDAPLAAVVLGPAAERLVDVLDRRAVEHRRRDVHAPTVLRDLLVGVRAVVVPAAAGDPAQVRLEDLPEVHPARHAERVQDHVDGRAVLEVRHVGLGHDLRDHALVAVAAGELVALGDLALLRHIYAHEVVDSRREVVVGRAAERLDVDHHAALAVRDLQRGVADLARLLLEDRADQLLLGGELGLALRRDLADEQVAGADLGPDPDDAAVVEVAQRLLRAVRDVARDLLVAQLRRAGVDLVLLDVDRGELVVLDEALGDDDRVLEVVALPRHEGDEAVLAECQLAHVGGRAVGQHLTALDLVAGADQRLLVDQRALVRAHVFLERVLVLAVARLDHDPLGVHIGDRARPVGQDHVAGVDGGPSLHAGAHQRGLGLEQRDRLALHVRAHEGAVGVVVLEEGDERGGHRPDLVRRHVHQVDLLGGGQHELALARAALDRRALELAALRVDLRVRLGDDQVLLLSGVEVDDLVRHDAVGHDAIGGRHEAVLGDLGEARKRAHQADVRALRRLDRAHAAIVRRVHVAHLDRRALARETARTERREAPPVGQAGQRVGLVHELAELGGAEELLQRSHDRTDVDDRLRGDRVCVFGGEALADHPLHPVEADPEGLLDQLADRAQAAVAEVLVLVEAVGDRLTRQRDGLQREVLDRLLALRGPVHAGLGDAELAGKRDQLLDQLDHVARGEHAIVERLVDMEAAVQLVAADARQVVALGVEEELVQQILGGVDRRRLARALLLEELDQRAVLRLGYLGVRLEREPDVEAAVEQLEDLLVAAGPGVRHVAAPAEGVAHGAEQDADRQLALAVDPDIDPALLVDLELEPRPARGHQVRDEDLLLAVLRLHHVGAGAPHQLRDDHALGAVDDERAPVRHPGEVAHEDGLLADLAGLAVLEGDLDRQRTRVGKVLLAALRDRRDRVVEVDVLEDDGEVSRVVLDRRDVVDRFA